jgi:Tfp pilus assembly protein PilV
MRYLLRLAGSARANPRGPLAGLVLLVALLGLLALQGRAAEEANARKSALALRFEQSAQDWLARPQDLSHFRRASDAGQLAAVGLAAAPPGLVLYTLKNGEQASTTVPNCTAAGCLGTLLDRFDDKAAAAGFALVRVDVDPRTASRRWLDAIAGVLSPLLLVGVFVFAMVLLTRM